MRVVSKQEDGNYWLEPARGREPSIEISDQAWYDYLAHCEEARKWHWFSLDIGNMIFEKELDNASSIR